MQGYKGLSCSPSEASCTSRSNCTGISASWLPTAGKLHPLCIPSPLCPISAGLLLAPVAQLQALYQTEFIKKTISRSPFSQTSIKRQSKEKFGESEISGNHPFPCSCRAAIRSADTDVVSWIMGRARRMRRVTEHPPDNLEGGRPLLAIILD